MKPYIAAMLAASLGSFAGGGISCPTGSRGIDRATGPGWSNAHAKRVASKARNVKRHRAASKGKA
jgi:hypothetical protein